jgi:hypothetical protein
LLKSTAFYEDDGWVALNLLLTHHRLVVIPVDHSRYAPTDTLFLRRGALSHGENADYSNFERLSAVMACLLLEENDQSLSDRVLI